MKATLEGVLATSWFENCPVAFCGVWLQMEMEMEVGMEMGLEMPMERGVGMGIKPI